MSIAMATTYFSIIINLFLFNDGKLSYSDFNCESRIIKDTVYMEYVCENTKSRCVINEIENQKKQKDNRVVCYDKKKQEVDDSFDIIYSPCLDKKVKKKPLYCKAD